MKSTKGSKAKLQNTLVWYGIVHWNENFQGGTK